LIEQTIFKELKDAAGRLYGMTDIQIHSFDHRPVTFGARALYVRQ
jgi:hypothetical protein